jgi:hypothetical protein
VAKIKKKPKAVVKTKKVNSKHVDKEIPVSEERDVQDGIMHTNTKVKEKPPEGYATVGLALGATLNVGDYQSARIDVFIQRNVKDEDEVIETEYIKMGETLQKEIERQSAILLDD